MPLDYSDMDPSSPHEIARATPLQLSYFKFPENLNTKKGIDTNHITVR